MTLGCFFLTTRVGAEYNSEEAISNLMRGYSENLQSCESFRSVMEDQFDKTYISADAITMQDPEKHFNIFVTAISK